MLLGRLFHRGKLLLGGNSHYALRRGKGGATVTQLLWKKQRDEPAASPGSGARDVVVFLGQAGDAGREAGRDDILAVSPSVPRWARVAHGARGLGEQCWGGWRAMGRWEGASWALTGGRGDVQSRFMGPKSVFERSWGQGWDLAAEVRDCIPEHRLPQPGEGAALLPVSRAAAPLSIPTNHVNRQERGPVAHFN